MLGDDTDLTDPMTLAQSSSSLDLLSSLVDHSLVCAGTGVGGEPRFVMLETIRAFALERLEASGEGEAVRARHAAWCLELAERARDAYWGRGPGDWGVRLVQELDNLRAALTALETSGEIAMMLRLATALAPLWTAVDHEREGYGWLTRALERRAAVPAVVTTAATLLASRLANALGDPHASNALAEEGATRAAATGDAPGLADAHCMRGNLAGGRGEQVEACVRYEDALARYRALGNRSQIGYTLIQ
jgi:hypothetical protein